MKKVCVFLADGFEEIEALTVVDILRRADVETIMVAVADGLTVAGSHNIQVKADAEFHDVNYAEVDMLVLPGGMPGTTNLEKYAPLTELLQEFAIKGKYLSAICAAPQILGTLGLLNGKRAVCYPGHEAKLEGAEVLKEEVVSDGNITTGRGMGASIPFALKLAEILKGKEIAEDLKNKIIYCHEIN